MENNGTYIKRKTINGVTIKLSSGDVELRKAFGIVCCPSDRNKDTVVQLLHVTLLCFRQKYHRNIKF